MASAWLPQSDTGAGVTTSWPLILSLSCSYANVSRCSSALVLLEELLHLISFCLQSDSKTTPEMELELATQQESGDVRNEAPPPSYHDSLRGDAKARTLPLQNNQEQDQPPVTKWFVCDSAEPSTWQLITSGSLMSNATGIEGVASPSKRRYRIVYPPSKYEDVYLHKSTWTGQATAFPPYYVEVFSGRKSYNPEPIIVLGPPAVVASDVVAEETRKLASVELHRVISAVDCQVSSMTRQATFAEMEFYSWNWTSKTAAANHDMRTMILRAKDECAKSLALVHGLEDLLAYVSVDKRDVSNSLRRSCEEVTLRLDRLRL